MSIRSLLNSVCDVYTLTVSTDGMGGVSESYGGSPRLSEQPCRIRAITGDERVRLGEEAIISTHRIYFEKGTEIDEKDRITLAEKNYDVLFVDNPHKMDRFIQADLILRD